MFQLNLTLFSFHPLGDLLIHWYRCERDIGKVDDLNRFVGPLRKAFEKRGDKLMENVALASAVYVDPRLHHDRTSPNLLGALAKDAEVILL